MLLRAIAFMRWGLVLALLCTSACRRFDYKVEGAGDVPAGMARYRTAAIEVVVAPGVTLSPAELGEFRADLAERVQETGVLRGSSDLELRVDIVAVETSSHFSFQHGEYTTSVVVVHVELRDRARQATIGQFVVRAGPGDKLPTFNPCSTMCMSLRNSARAVGNVLEDHE